MKKQNLKRYFNPENFKTLALRSGTFDDSLKTTVELVNSRKRLEEEEGEEEEEDVRINIGRIKIRKR